MFNTRFSVCLCSALAVCLTLLPGCRLFRSNSASPAPPAAPVAAPLFEGPVQGSSEPPALIRGSDAPTTMSTYRPPGLPGSESTVSTPVTVEKLSERVEAFRPIVSEHLQTATAPAPRIEYKTDPAVQAELDKLSGEVARLQKALDESEENLLKTRQEAERKRLEAATRENAVGESHPDDPFLRHLAGEPVAAVATEVLRPESRSNSAAWSPVFNIQGLTVVSDRQATRIEIVDTALFHRDSWELNPAGEETLRKIVGEIKAHDPGAFLEIEGHTDNIVIDPANATQKLDLASHKSRVVMQYFLNTLRWNPDRIKTSSFGSTRPVADNGTAEGRARNNRIEIVVPRGE